MRQHTRLLVPSALAAISLALAACGSDGGNSTPASTPAAAGAPTVSVADAANVGSILVDSTGRALYSPDEEAGATIRCVDACTSFWVPLQAGTAAPVAGPGAPALSVVARPDGMKQVAANGHPLYTFTQDSPGTVTGNGFADDFGGQHFTWHVVMSDGSIAAAGAGVVPTPTTPGGYGYGAGY